MSGTSWFDLTSIQDQINKSIQEAAKIAEEASKYDILNFDGMAEQDEEEEREYDSEEDESQIPTTNAKNNDCDTNYLENTSYSEESPDIDRKIFRTENINQTPVAHKDSSSPVFSTHQIVRTEVSDDKSASFDYDDADFPTVMTGRSDIHRHVNAGDTQLPSFELGTHTHDYEREKLEEDRHDIEILKGLDISMPTLAKNGTKSLKPMSVPHIVPFSSSLPSSGDTAVDLVSNFSSPQKKSIPSRNFDDNQKVVNDSNDRHENDFNDADAGSHFQEISLIMNTVDTAENKQKILGNIDNTGTPSSSYRSANESLISEVVVTEGVADDFFGDQFKNISTIKKEKLTSTSTYTSQLESTTTMIKNAPSSSSAMRESIVNDEGGFPSSDNLLKVKGSTSVLLAEKTSEKGGKVSVSYPSSNKGVLQIAEKKKESAIGVNPIGYVKKKGRKKKKDKGSLDFFGISSKPSAPSSSNSAAVLDKNTNNFSIFETTMMLNDDSEELDYNIKCDPLEGFASPQLLAQSEEGEEVEQRASLSSNGRLPQRLPGLSTISFLNAAVAGKVLFSYFDNEEDENEAAEDPILRQVALNKSNPQPKEYSQSQMYAKSLTFGNFSTSSSSIYENSRNEDKVDIENKGKMIANDVGDDGVPVDNVSAFQNNDMCSNTLLLFKVLLEGAIVFTRGLCGCLYIACREATNGVGAPLRQRDDLASRLRRGEVVPAPLDSEIGGSSSIRGGSWIRMLLVMLNALRDPEGRQVRIIQIRVLLLSIWENISSVNGISILTMLLFVFSYFKFARYGTDAGD